MPSAALPGGDGLVPVPADGGRVRALERPALLPRPLETPADTLDEVMGEAVGVLEATALPYLLVGGVASSIYGRPRTTRDVDLLVARDDARRALDALRAAGFDTEETDPHWIYKARRHGVVVDVLFELKGGVYLDDAMLRRSTRSLFRDCAVRVAPPEDIVVTKAIAHDKPSFHHWHDALGVLAERRLDWRYLLARGRRGPRRLLSLLVYAQSDDLAVPDWVIRRLADATYPATPGDR